MLNITPLLSEVRRVGMQSVMTAAVTVRDSIRSNSAIGVDVNAKNFKPYTPAYAKVRRAKGLRIDRVNLRVTGGLMKSLVIRRVTNNEVVLTLPSEYQPIGQGNQNHRNWFGIGKLDIPLIRKAIAQNVR